MESMESSNANLDNDLQLVIRDILDENRQINSSNSSIIESVNRLTNKVNEFQGKLEKIQTLTPQIDTKSIKEVVEKGYIDLSQLIDLKLSKIQESNLRVFLMSDAKKWLVYLILGIVMLTYAYKLLNR